MAGGNFSKLAVKGGVIGVYINWNCDLDWDFETYCLPKYNFRILDNFGWNFRHAYYHEEHRRTLVKAYGLKFMVVVDGFGSKFDLKNTVIVLVTGLGLLGLSTMFCDFILLNYSTDRKRVRIVMGMRAPFLKNIYRISLLGLKVMKMVFLGVFCEKMWQSREKYWFDEERVT